MYYEYFVNSLSQVLTPGTTGILANQNTIAIDSDADFSFSKTSYVATNDRIKLRYRDDSFGRYLIKDPVDIKTIAGRNTLDMGESSSFLPFIWPQPYTIAAGTTFTTELGDYSNAANTVRLAFHGAKIRPGTAPWDKKWRLMLPFVYTFDGGSVSVPANATANPAIKIDKDAHFLVKKITAIRTGGALISINDTARGQDLSNTPVHIDNLCGNGAFPNILTAPRFVNRGSVLSITIQNLIGIANNIEVNLVGVKLYE